jgi:hypothetical protein
MKYLIIIKILNPYNLFQALSTQILANKIMNSNFNDKITEILKTFLLQANHRSKVIRSAVFNIDWTLMLSVTEFKTIHHFA